MSTRSVLGLIYTVQGLTGLGFDPQPILKRHGVDLTRISPEAEIERTRELKIYDEIMRSWHDPLAGLKIGKQMSLAGYGPFIMLIMSCKNAWEAFNCGIRYQELTYLFGELALEAGEKHSALSITPILLPASCRRFLEDRDLSGTYQLIQDMQMQMGFDLSPTRIELTTEEPDDIRPYQKRYQCELIFSQPKMRIHFDTEFLGRQFPGANYAAHSLYRQQCEQILTRRERQQTRSSLSQQVIGLLELFEDEFPNAANVAASCGISERTLRRRLSEEGCSFRKLLEQVRSNKARKLLLNSQLTIDQIATKLGYTEAAAFIHAFQRWFNQTPASFRAQHY